ncbi:immune inhibitor A domain-containing protein [Aeromicrobium wangtongii]|uniref:Immune inhibitor A n=1 Tax=Aeromicrobium wangtongii TaxID=2969247 RepID=A0ABY5M5U7_9ACTN|nr:immune inhibitor A domain-containing protein [Aeromicrobium wangtongii]MCD9198278.1 immune inhibitor A [Aeromicrobium wangtongii]UUP12310.1 immune inhibitor A [Aeromicrobium wangtongii]
MTSGLMGLTLAASLGLAYASPGTAAEAPSVKAQDQPSKVGKDDLPNPLEDKRRALRESGLTSVINGEATPVDKNGASVVKVGKGYSPAEAAALANKRATKNQRQAIQKSQKKDQYVELSQERADKIFVILTEFGNQRHPDFPDQDTDPSVEGPTTFDGPLHNQIPQPDRTKDNSTVWQKNYNRKHYQDLYFGSGDGVESVKTYFETQSSGRYTVDGQVQDWVKVPYNEARYGRDESYRTVWNLIQDSLTAWVADQKAAGRTDAQIKKTIASYDQYDRYDFDGDGDFNEPDGYIDHFQIVHAGGDEADGDPQQGEDAIWSHRWYAFGTDAGLTGPPQNRLGGAQVGNTGIWVGDYTAQPENGGLSVFAHEFGHDLGLPDDYDTSGGGDNNNEYWTLMAQSRLNAAGEALGTRPGDLGAWNKLQLGWLDYEALSTKQQKTLNLGPEEYNTKKAQAAVVVLPKKQIIRQNGAPASGTKQFFSGSGDDLNNSMTTSVDLTGKTAAVLDAKVRYEIEAGYDYAYVQAQAEGETTWKSLNGTVGGTPIPLDPSGNAALSGEQKTWAALNVPLGAYDGKKIKLRFLYKTDGGVAEAGLFVDDVTVKAGTETLLADGAENGGPTWTFDGFSIVGPTSTDLYDNYYIAGHRSYVSYDQYLQTGPYNFGFANTKPDWVEHYKYGHGLLISYWDTSQRDNNTNVHPGTGRNLYIDANPEPIINIATGAPWRARIQMYDAPFSLHKADSMTLHTNGKPSYIRGQAAKPLFDDTQKYWYAELPNHGVKLPAAGVKIRVQKENGTSMKVKFN